MASVALEEAFIGELGSLPFDQENLEKYLNSLYQEQAQVVTVRERSTVEQSRDVQ